jgi:mono/diheme cytochrome c family protein
MLALRLAVGVALAALVGGAAFWWLTRPNALSAAEIAALPEGDAARGETVFWAGGCASCHAAERAEGDDRLRLGGGLRLETGFGVFVAPNVSPHPEDGIGRWTAGDFANAMLRGVSPDGAHYYPAFPYTSYARMTPQDVADLWAFVQTLPQVEGRPEGHALAFPYDLRRGLGLWKRAFLSDAPVAAVDAGDPALARGRYLVEGPGHCAECHTPRNRAGGLVAARWMAGGPNPEGEGRIPNITGGEGGIGSWSAADVAYYLETGFTPDFDTVGGSMVAVQRNMAELPPEDRAAIAAYIKALPPLPRRG